MDIKFTNLEATSWNAKNGKPFSGFIIRGFVLDAAGNDTGKPFEKKVLSNNPAVAVLKSCSANSKVRIIDDGGTYKNVVGAEILGQMSTAISSSEFPAGKNGAKPTPWNNKADNFRSPDEIGRTESLRIATNLVAAMLPLDGMFKKKPDAAFLAQYTKDVAGSFFAYIQGKDEVKAEQIPQEGEELEVEEEAF